jgi:hypothetical protein
MSGQEHNSMERFDHPLVFLFFNGIATFAVILLIVYLMARFGLGNPIAMAAGEA